VGELAVTIEIRTRSLATRELNFGVLEAGSGPLALCLHGFPDTAHTWRHLLPSLADAGFHAVAPFMRGYAPTEIPGDGDYSRGSLAADALSIHDALGADERAVLIGHDWGAGAAYDAASVAPPRWRRLVTLAIPRAPLDALLFGEYEQLKRFFYMFLFQLPFAEEIVSRDQMAFLERQWSDWSPDYDASADLRWVKQSLAERANLSAALGYYRAMFAGPGGVPPPLRQAPQPTLYLHGDCDGCIGIELVRDAERRLAAGSRMVVVQNAGHFLHLEAPEAVGEQIVEWVSA
jgi:pimeloyl-ACP methyl ester carboxylesterase